MTRPIALLAALATLVTLGAAACGPAATATPSPASRGPLTVTADVRAS